MKRFLIAVTTGAFVAATVYLCVAWPIYNDLLAHQPTSIPIQAGATSYPPYFAFFAALLSIPITFPVAAGITWLAHFYFSRGKTAPKIQSGDLNLKSASQPLN
jgi:hypothetical protein